MSEHAGNNKETPKPECEWMMKRDALGIHTAAPVTTIVMCVLTIVLPGEEKRGNQKTINFGYESDRVVLAIAEPGLMSQPRTP
ncbi:hypothetical protein [Cellvibrio sp. PSBB006]|uniref:hypothetical protein n=1 Tax=Cellvibrio sp. PSBB006 TaxID=1987723 RepID=UPI0018E03901|nr:hypothetical protein [Cellvibrio sp. PSBB006]